MTSLAFDIIVNQRLRAPQTFSPSSSFIIRSRWTKNHRITNATQLYGWGECLWLQITIHSKGRIVQRPWNGSLIVASPKKREGNKRKKNREHTRSIDIKRRRSWWTLLVSLRSWSWRCSSSESRLFKVKTTKGSNGILLSTKPCDQGPIKVSALRLYKTNAIRNLSWPKVNKKIHIKGDIFFCGWFCVCVECVLMKTTKRIATSFFKKKEEEKTKSNQLVVKELL